VLAVSNYGYSNAWLENPGTAPSPNGWWLVYAAYMGVWVMMMYTFDFARFGKPEDEDYHARFNFGAPFYIVTMAVSGLVGIFLVNTIPLDGGISEVSAVKGIIVMMGLFGLLFVWVTQTRINTANFYLSAVNLESFLRLVFGLKVTKLVAAILAGAIIFVLMLADIFHYMLITLAYQGIFVVAWIGVALSYILGQGKSDPIDAAAKPDEAYPAFNAGGLIAWFGAVIVGTVFMQMPTLAPYSAPATAILSFLLFRLVPSKSLRVSAT